MAIDGGEIHKLALLSKAKGRELVSLLSRDLLKPQNAIGLAGPDADLAAWNLWLQVYTEDCILPRFFSTFEDITEWYMSNKSLVDNYVRARAILVAKCHRKHAVISSRACEEDRERPTSPAASAVSTVDATFDHAEQEGENKPGSSNESTVPQKLKLKKTNSSTMRVKKALARIAAQRQHVAMALLQSVGDELEDGIQSTSHFLANGDDNDIDTPIEQASLQTLGFAVHVASTSGHLVHPTL